MPSVCFVCLGNICRSPTAEGVMRHLVAQAGLQDALGIDSAGTAAYHVGEPPDRRSAAAARKRGIVLSGKARRFEPADFDRFDLVLAMDRSNRAALMSMARNGDGLPKIRMLREFDPTAPPEAEVPDPYYGGVDGFEEVLDICERACAGLLAHLRQTAGLGDG